MNNEDEPPYEYQELAHAMRDAFPRADYGSDERISSAWNRFVSELERVLTLHDPSFDSNKFLHEARFGGGFEHSGMSRAERRMFTAIGLVVVAILSTFWVQGAIKNARMEGHDDIYATVCANHPRVAPLILPVDDSGIPVTCRDYAHYFDEH